MNHKRSLVDEAKHVSRKERKKRIDVVLMNESNREREQENKRERKRESGIPFRIRKSAYNNR